MTVRVDADTARDVAAAYADASPVREPLVVAAYARLVTESDQLFRRLTTPERPDRVRILFTTCPAPYADAHELVSSVRHEQLLEVTTVAVTGDRRHPAMGSELGGAYDRFRAVHDVLGHARLGLGFDRDGEFTVWRSQARFHSPLARWALATELHGQHSVLWTTGQLAQPKAVLLDPRVLRRSITAALRPHPHPTGQPKGSS
ncbi:MAG TPA: hypothetical protein VFY82_05205 [Acidimicrobiales bacterium]|nr:hypothetical protein [Acidimicrobiales bacterium]